MTVLFVQTPESVQSIPRGVPARSREDNISEGAGVQMEHKQKTAQVHSISIEHISSRNERSIYARPSQTYLRPCVKRLDSEQGIAARFMSDVYRAPRDVDPEESTDFRQALAAGEPIIVWIDHCVFPVAFPMDEYLADTSSDHAPHGREPPAKKLCRTGCRTAFLKWPLLLAQMKRSNGAWLVALHLDKHVANTDPGHSLKRLGTKKLFRKGIIHYWNGISV